MSQSSPKHKKDFGDDESDLLMPHEYDGIREYNNRLPNWWLFTLYGAIIFSIGYWFYYYAGEEQQDDVAKLYAEMEQLQAARAQVDIEINNASLWTMSQKSEPLSHGESIYTQNCKACHGEELKGGVGANLRDNEWLHGSAPTAVYQTIMNGVQAKGMPAWESQLGKKKAAQVSAYVLSYHEPPKNDNAGATSAENEPNQ